MRRDVTYIGRRRAFPLMTFTNVLGAIGKFKRRRDSGGALHYIHNGELIYLFQSKSDEKRRLLTLI